MSAPTELFAKLVENSDYNDEDGFMTTSEFDDILEEVYTQYKDSIGYKRCGDIALLETTVRTFDADFSSYCKEHIPVDHNTRNQCKDIRHTFYERAGKDYVYRLWYDREF